ncbi:MAG: RNA polymerase sigma factor RpoS, partial [Betaproteobacteria bacterium]|nr:RNA polymerase sigma factor RpoS [Betaproteobacteria bacterium]
MEQLYQEDPDPSSDWSAVEGADEEDASGPVEASAYFVEPDDDITQMYLNEIGHQRLLTPKEEHALACRAKEGDQQARQAMIEH